MGVFRIGSMQISLGNFSPQERLNDNENLKNAEIAYERFMNLTGEVLRLSRMNTNIKSAELSLGKKRLLSSQCQEILASLQKSIQAQGNCSLPILKKKEEMNNFGNNLIKFNCVFNACKMET
jgi:hypothetical protein